ncbi:chloride channel protein [Saccharophagus degradans]|uniref:chloride channel protein n=1 Tax=Saccharophagus degradans TaxID=86304 RepID=UPI0024781FA5|nr:chloride channel protein [Saccharophagus degradans]WGO97724.1 chloride channel protein [Saccharophagus degradans]
MPETRTQRLLANFRHSLAYIDALPQLTLLGLIIGLFTGVIIVIFRLLIDLPLSYFLDTRPDNFEAMPTDMIWLLIMGGTIPIAILLHFAGKKRSQTGVSHVIDRLHNYQGQLPTSNWMVQFFGAALCMLSGQSVGREGPAVHLGAGVASKLGKWLNLPNNSLLTLIACGVAAGISASFDTPMAGVIFAMEVVVLEYTVVGFVPVILASVMGTMVSQLVFGEASNFKIGPVDMGSLLELPYMIVMGLAISVCAAAYIKLNLGAMRLSKYPVALRVIVAGLLTATIASGVPEVMGLGYDTVNAIIVGEVLLFSLLIIGVAKLFLTPVVVGLGMPGGVIGPLLVVGACLGGVLGTFFDAVFPNLGASPGFYVVLGMAGMMAATLNAPLAALVAVLELSYNPNMIFPAMLVIVVSCLSTRQLFSLDSIFTEQLRLTNRLPEEGPANSALRRAGVGSILDKKVKPCAQIHDYEQAKLLLQDKPRWIIIENEDKKFALQAADLAKYLEEAPVEVLSLEKDIDLMDIPGRRHRLHPIHETATLYEALKAMRAKDTDMLYVARHRSPLISDVFGLVRLIDIENFYQPKEFRKA